MGIKWDIEVSRYGKDSVTLPLNLFIFFYVLGYHSVWFLLGCGMTREVDL